LMLAGYSSTFDVLDYLVDMKLVMCRTLSSEVMYLCPVLDSLPNLVAMESESGRRSTNQSGATRSVSKTAKTT